ncbi:MAG: hypothetical protein WBZ20_08700, partial [Nitrososphaeraceae archaeon]
RHERLTIVNSSTTTQSLVVAYTGLAWNIGTNLGTEVIWHNGALDGYVSLLAFNPVKQIGLVILCSCDERDAVPPAVYVVPSLLNPSSIFTPGKVASTINANASVVAPGNVK